MAIRLVSRELPMLYAKLAHEPVRADTDKRADSSDGRRKYSLGKELQRGVHIPS